MLVSGVAEGVAGFVRGVAGGSLPPPAVAALVAVALIGIVLLVAELKPRTPRRVRMDKGTYVTRGVVKQRTEAAAGVLPEVLESSAKVRARRRSGAKVDLEARVRSGVDTRGLKKTVRDRVGERLGSGGIPVGRLKVEIAEVDPRTAKTRVK
ncbi:MAG: hypothetical protein H0V21_05485 [Rubrobacter sp.]|nr:hypothetical protein [Rubrobacter sp.]